MIDWQRVAELRDEIGEEDFGEVVEIFLEEVSSTMEDLKTAPSDENLHDKLHFLKGSALNLGFEALGQLCSDAERAAADGQSEQVDRGAIVDCYTTSRTQFLSASNSAAA